MTRVDDQTVSPPQERRELRERTVLEGRARAVDQEKPGGAAHIARRLGDQLRREVVVELREIHDTPV
jgi:hypothetical protein